MTVILIVDKSGNIKEVNIKSYNEEEIYKKAGLKTTDGFSIQTKWMVEINSQKHNILLYAKTKGKAGQENKYDFPPPVDNALYFGNCILVNTNESNIAEDLTEKIWEKIYEKLFGGFEDIGSEDSEESKDTDPDLPRTKSGYVKDDFIVDSDEVSDDKDSSEESEEEIKEKKCKKKVTKKTVFESIDTNSVEEVPTELNCTIELVEEEYL
jgi:hypothetical protein